MSNLSIQPLSVRIPTEPSDIATLQELIPTFFELPASAQRELAYLIQLAGTFIGVFTEVTRLATSKEPAMEAVAGFYIVTLVGTIVTTVHANPQPTIPIQELPTTHRQTLNSLIFAHSLIALVQAYEAEFRDVTDFHALAKNRSEVISTFWATALITMQAVHETSTETHH